MELHYIQCKIFFKSDFWHTFHLNGWKVKYIRIRYSHVLVQWAVTTLDLDSWTIFIFLNMIVLIIYIIYILYMYLYWLQTFK